MQQGTSISHESLQSALESAPNALAKGQAQFFTPPEFARRCAGGLPEYRPVIADLNCGNGQFLAGAANDSTIHRLGLDIQRPVRKACEFLSIQADVTVAFPLLVEAEVEFDLFTLNPPWDLHWPKDRLSALAESDLLAVREAFAQRDLRLGPDHLDSTMAMLMMALDRLTYRGEGVLIGNEATLQRLLFGHRAPYSALVPHVWYHAAVEGNPMTGVAGHQFGDEFRTGVIYFARSHETGPVHARDLRTSRCYRRGADVRADWQSASEGTVEGWKAVQEELRTRQTSPGSGSASWNLWLGADGLIRTQLSLFQQRSVKVDKAAARVLFDLNDRRPMELVLQRASRDALLQAAGIKGPPLPWRADPALVAAIEQAMAQYESARAPLYPLPKILRLGYLDEEDSIKCISDFGERNADFRSGIRYDLRTQTIEVKRKERRPNLLGEEEELEFTGHELAFYVTDGRGMEHCFLDERALQKDVELSPLWPADKCPVPAGERVHTLQELADHFEIPNVPDVSATAPERHAAYRKALDELQGWMAAV